MSFHVYRASHGRRNLRRQRPQRAISHWMTGRNRLRPINLLKRVSSTRRSCKDGSVDSHGCRRLAQRLLRPRHQLMLSPTRHHVRPISRTPTRPPSIWANYYCCSMIVFWRMVQLALSRRQEGGTRTAQAIKSPTMATPTKRVSARQCTAT